MGGHKSAHGFQSVRPVFYDVTRRRWRGFTRVTTGLTVGVTMLFGFLGFSILETPRLDTSALYPRDVALASIGPVFEPVIAREIVVEAVAERAAFVPVSRVLVADLPAPLSPSRKQPKPIAVAPAPAVDAPIVVPKTVTVTFPQLRPADLAVREKPRPSPAKPRVRDISSPSFVTLSRPKSSQSNSSIVKLGEASFGRDHGEAKLVSALDGVLAVLGTFFVPAVNAQEYTAPQRPEVQAFHVNWDPASASSLHEFVSNIDVVVPDWLSLNEEGTGALFDLSERTMEVVRLREMAHPDLKIIPLLTNYSDGRWDGEKLRRLMASPSQSATFADQLVTGLQANNWQGVTLRFSGLTADDRAAHLQFVSALASALNPHGLGLQHVVNIEGGALDPTLFVDLVDRIILEAHGETAIEDAAGPLASQNWLATLAQNWAKRLPPEKIIFSLGNFSYDWAEGEPAQRIDNLAAYRRAAEFGASVSLDRTSLNARFEYVARDGRAHSVWMLDGVSAYNQLRALAPLGVAGVALDRLGTEDASIWPLLAAPFQAHSSALERIDYSYQIGRNGTGVVVKLVDVPAVGQRQLSLGAQGEVVGAELISLPRAYEIDQWGSNDPTQVTLTFDDGPDPRYTPQILDILKQYNVKASFFTLGSQMLRHPKLVQRILDEGHDIGSHTYSHVNISKMTPEILTVDLNTTQRVFESIAGRHAALFRAPYAADTNPTTPSEIAPLATVGELGYLTVNMNIDSKDWWLPTASRIAQDTINGLGKGDDNVILLHDGGGDRQATVDALPVIIETVLAEGYHFVPVSSLIGLTPDQVMPRVAERVSPVGVVRNFGFAVVREAEKLIVGLFFVAIVLGVARSLILISLSSLRKRHAAPLHPDPILRVGVVVPAYNEAKVVVQTVRSLLQSDFKNLQILVVDDGSTDGTFARCQSVFAGVENVQVMTKPNGGKASALNLGFARLEVDVVVAMDADTVFMPDTISKMVRHFGDDQVMAVAGNAKVGNRLNMLTRWQAVEYITAQNLDRRAFELLNCITVVPGAVGAWRREKVLELAGFSTDTLAEDADLTVRILRAGYRVVYEEDALAYTEAPATTKQLLKQRFRWMFGMLQVTQKHRGAMALKDSKSFALAGMPNILLFQILFPLLAPVADLVAVTTLIGLGIQIGTGSSLMGLQDGLMFLGLFGAFVLLDFMAAVIAFGHEKREDWRLLLWVLPQRFYYRQLLYIVAIRSVLMAIRGTAVGWGNLERKASVAVKMQPQT